MSPGPATLPLRLYGALGRVLSGPALARSDRKLTGAGIAEDRLAERRGQATCARPDGTLIWLHAASVGESLSALPLVSRLVQDHAVLVTSGTGTSAQIMTDRLPKGAIHQFAPIDTGPAVRAFHDHWRPDLAVFVESELWPRLILETEIRGVPLALVNARMSERSLHKWARVPATARRVLSAFRLIVAQNAQTLDGLERLLPDATELRIGGNLKTAIPPPSADPALLAEWRNQLGDRPVWTASSTHHGEDEAVLDAHAAIQSEFPDALCILIPRHPERGSDIAALAEGRGFATQRRTAADALANDTEVYVADTIGETGLWYRAAPIVFLAGSFGDAGGHNPWEPVGCGAALLHGPHVVNAAQDYEALADRGAARMVEDAAELAKSVTGLFHTPEKRRAMQTAAASAMNEAGHVADALSAELAAMIGPADAG